MTDKTIEEARRLLAGEHTKCGFTGHAYEYLSSTLDDYPEMLALTAVIRERDEVLKVLRDFIDRREAHRNGNQHPKSERQIVADMKAILVKHGKQTI